MSEEETDILIDEDLENFKFSVDKNPSMTVTMEASGIYRYQLPDGSAFTITSPVGMFTNKPVVFVPGEEQTVLSVTKDGEPLYLSDYTFSEEGSYCITILSSSGDDSLAGFKAYQAELSFQIGNTVVSGMDSLIIPDEFVLAEAYCNGQQLAYDQDRSELTQDGYYEFIWKGKNDSSVIYKNSFILDSEAPTLTFSKDITEGIIRPPLTMEASEPGCVVTVRQGAEIVELTDWVLNDSGSYQITVSDQAGNSTDYRVTVGLPCSVSGTQLFIIFALLLAAGSLGMHYYRRHMQVL